MKRLYQPVAPIKLLTCFAVFGYFSSLKQNLDLATLMVRLAESKQRATRSSNSKCVLKSGDTIKRSSR
ncbi:hypothetical protein CVS40_9335 [Lucilia cuprina]|nr:hypothetical protein CVS40_9335 [Lucilia cuprina]